MKKNLMKTTSAFLASLLALTGLPVFGAAAQEETVHDYAYYAAMSDYDVYAEYCQRFGYTAEETLPENFRDFPGGFFMKDNFRGWGGCWNHCDDEDCPYDTKNPSYPFLLTGDLDGVEALGRDLAPALLGLPEGVRIYTERETATFGSEEYQYMEITVSFSDASRGKPGSLEYVETVPDVYRVLLSVYDSAFVKTYAKPVYTDTDFPENGFKLGTLKMYGGQTTLGVVTRSGEGQPSAVDASVILQYAANAGNSNAPRWCMERQYIADFNKDGQVDAADASLILQYAAVTGNGGKAN